MDNINDVFKEISNLEFKSVGERIKFFENENLTRLIPGMPIIVRLGGHAFKKYTERFKKPYDSIILESMKYATLKLCSEVQNVKLAYSHNDEITLVILDPNDQMWFNGEKYKIVSLCSSLTTFYFNDYMETNHWSTNEGKTPAIFDCRVFQVPRNEVENVLIWRQRGAIRKSISAYSQLYFKPKELENKSSNEKLKMLLKVVEWEQIPIVNRRGFCVVKEISILEPGVKTKSRYKWGFDEEIPIFSKDREFINCLVRIPEL